MASDKVKIQSVIQVVLVILLIESCGTMQPDSIRSSIEDCKSIPFQVDPSIAREMTIALKENIDNGDYFFIDDNNWRNYFTELRYPVDVEKYIYVFAYRGLFRTGGYETIIKDICLHDDTVEVIIDLLNPTGVVTDAESYSMDSVRIEKRFWPVDPDVNFSFEEEK